MSEENFEFSKEEGEKWDRFLEDTEEEKARLAKKYEDPSINVLAQERKSSPRKTSN